MGWRRRLKNSSIGD